MAKKQGPYAPEFRRQMIELVRAGRGLVRSGDGCDPAEGLQFVSENQACYTLSP